jgi:TP901 family phage tail tape measure protein
VELFKLFGTILINNAQANAELYETDRAAKAAAKELEELSTQAADMAIAVGAAAAAFVAGIGVKAVMAADDLKKSLNLLQAQTGASDTDMKQFEDSIMRLYKENMGEGFEDIASSMSEISRTTGLSGKELEKTTKNAIALRDTFQFGVNETARTANSLIKQFGVSADEAYEIITQSAQKGANKNGDLLDTLNEYSGMFKSAGYSAEEFGNILIQGAKDGSFSIDMVGDAVKESNIRLKDGSKTSREAVQGLGLSYDEIASNFAKGGELAASAYNTVLTNLNKIEDPLKKNDLAVKLFGTQFEDLETTILGTLTNAGKHIDLTKSSLDQINKVKYDTFGEALAGLGRQINADFFIPLGKKIIPKLEELMDILKENEKEIKAGLNVAVKVLTGLFKGLLEVVEFIIDNFNWLKYAIIGVTGAIIAQFVIGTLIPLYKAWRATTVGMTFAQAALNAVMKLNPFSWVAIAIGVAIAAIVLLIMNWDKVVKYLAKAWKWIKDTFKKALDWTKEKVKSAFEWMRDKIVSSWDAIKNAAKSVWDGLMAFFKTTIGKIVAVLGGPITIGLAIIANWETIKSKATQIWNGIISFFTGAIEKIKSVFSGLKSGIYNIFESIWSNIKSVFDKIANIFKGFRGTLEGLFDGLWDFIKSPLNLIISGLNFFIKGYESMLNNVISAINSIPDIEAPDWLGGGEFGIPDLKKVTFAKIPGLAEGGSITKAGTVMVGEQGPEFLNLPRGAEVVPLDKQQQSVVININNAKIMNDKDAENLGDLLVRYLKKKGIAPRGV